MNVVIEIPEKLYEKAQTNNYDALDGVDAMIALKNGTPLSKSHGQLIDGDYLYRKFVANKCHDSLTLQCIKDEPTIIEADKE